MPPSSHWTMNWSDRPTDEAVLFNPAFGGEILARTVIEYCRHRGSTFPLPLLFLVLPLVLHPQTRQALPGRANAAFASWSAENSALLADIPERVIHLRSVTRESLLLMLQAQVLNVEQDGLSTGNRPFSLSKRPSIVTDEVEEIRKSAGLLGRWFAGPVTAAAIMQSMGARL